MNDTTHEDFILQGKDAEAVGYLADGGFVVRKGATVRKEIVPSATGYVASHRERLISEGAFTDEGDTLRLARHK